MNTIRSEKFYRVALKMAAVVSIIVLGLGVLAYFQNRTDGDKTYIGYILVAKDTVYYIIAEMILSVITFVLSILFLKYNAGIAGKVVFEIFSLLIWIVGIIEYTFNNPYATATMILFSIIQLLMLISFIIGIKRNKKPHTKPIKTKQRAKNNLENVSLDEKGELSDSENKST